MRRVDEPFGAPVACLYQGPPLTSPDQASMSTAVTRRLTLHHFVHCRAYVDHFRDCNEAVWRPIQVLPSLE
jgi:hypothetical protein